MKPNPNPCHHVLVSMGITPPPPPALLLLSCNLLSCFGMNPCENILFLLFFYNYVHFRWRGHLKVTARSNYLYKTGNNKVKKIMVYKNTQGGEIGYRWAQCLITFTPWSFLLNPLTAKLFNLNFQPLEVVSRWRDPQLQVSENYSDLTKWRSTVFKFCWLLSHFIFTMF